MKTKLWNNYKHIIPALVYALFYIILFIRLENKHVYNYTVIHMNIDNYIPFLEVFVIPYFLWFLYVAGIIIYFFFTNKRDYYKACAFLFTGMTLFLIVSFLFPNGHHLRPQIMPRDNIFTDLITFLYNSDTSTNIVPSIHVYNSLGAHLAITKSERLSQNKWIRGASFILCTSIILSTVFIKQHSMFDVITAYLLAGFMYLAVYKIDYSFVAQRNAFPKVGNREL